MILTAWTAQRVGRASLVAGVLAIAAPATWAKASAESWLPSRPVKIVVPYGAGGVTDVTARIMADQLSNGLGQAFVIENRSTANGAVGTDYVVHAPPDGHTIYVASAQQFAVLPLTQQIAYDPVADLAPIGTVGVSGMALAVNAKVPVRSLAELIAYAKANPGRLNYGFSGLGTTSHLAAAAFAARAGVDLVAIPYPTPPQVMTDLLSGTIQIYFGNSANLIGPAASGQVRLLAVSTDRRMPQLPEVPPLAEDLPGFVLNVWQGAFVPAGTPQPIVDRYAQELAALCGDPGVVKRFTDISIEPRCDSAADLSMTIRRELPLYASAVAAAGLSRK